MDFGKSASVRGSKAKTIVGSSACSSFTRSTFFTTDASSVGLGAELAQVTPENVVKPVAYFSRVLSKTERQHSTYDREFLAVIAAVRHFRHHLWAQPFVFEQHGGLQFVRNAKDRWGRRAKRIAELQEYDFEMEFIDGRDNLVADALKVAWSLEVSEGFIRWDCRHLGHWKCFVRPK